MRSRNASRSSIYCTFYCFCLFPQCIIFYFFLHLQEFYTNDPKSFADYGRIINQRHFKRLMALIEGSTVAVGGESDEAECYIGMYAILYPFVMVS